MKILKQIINAFIFLVLLVVIIILVEQATSVANFVNNLSLNLLSEIIGAILIAFILRTEFRRQFDKANENIMSLINQFELSLKFKEGFREDSPEAWDDFNMFQKNRLALLEERQGKTNNKERKNKINNEIKLIQEYLKHTK